MLQGRSSCSLAINVLSGANLKNVQKLGKQDPYLQLTLDFENKDQFVRTHPHQNSGDTATWNQSFTLTISGEPDLFIEVLDKESTIDEVIGFAAIPINQVVHANGAYLNGIFDIYDTKSEKAGQVNLQLAAIGFPNSENPDWQKPAVRGQSYIHEGHLQRMKSGQRKQQGAAVGGALLGGALALGAAYFGKKMYDQREEQQAEEERQQQEEQRRREEEERNRREEQEKFNQDRQQFDAERQRFEREKSDYEQSIHSNQGNYERRQEEEHHEHRREHHEHHEHRRHHSGGGDAERWNPVGTYAAGDRVEYHGQVYVCLQGHTSNPTWQPGAAHSLWQSE